MQQTDDITYKETNPHFITSHHITSHRIIIEKHKASLSIRQKTPTELLIMEKHIENSSLKRSWNYSKGGFGLWWVFWFSLIKIASCNIHYESVSYIILLQPYKGFVNVIHLHNLNHGTQALLFAELKHLLCFLYAPYKAPCDRLSPY